MPPAKKNSGNIFIPLLILLLMSAGVLLLAQFFAKAQTDVSASIDIRFQGLEVTPSTFMESSQDKWQSYENTNYHYNIKFPEQWVSSNTDPIIGDLSTYERFLGNKINLRVSVRNKFDTNANLRTAKFGDNSFYIDNNKVFFNSATTEHNKLFYTIELKENNYFSSNIEFTGTFFHILQGFKFTK